MAKTWIDQTAIKTNLSAYFRQNELDLEKFGRTVNQTFEAFVFVSVAEWYTDHGWQVEVINAVESETGKREIHLKFNTRGRPDKYTYFKCKKGDQEIQIRHQLRIATYSYIEEDDDPRANIVLDVAVINSNDLSAFETDDHVENQHLITFGEAKHMSAFAELVANFIGLVHELKPDLLKRRKSRKLGNANREHLAAFLYVSGLIYPTAQGIKKTIEKRGYDIDIYNRTETLSKASNLPVMPAKKKRP